MRKKKRSAVRPAILLTAAAGLLLFSTVGSTRAALMYYSENYAAEVTVSSIGITLTENGEKISYRDYTNGGNEWNEAEGKLLTKLLAEGEALMPGKEYPERLGVTNSGSIDTYVRVIVTRSWMDAQGKDTTLTPALIDLHYLENGWIIDPAASTEERTILYCTKPVLAGQAAPDLTDTLKIDSTITNKVTQNVTEVGGNKTIETVYDYDGYQFHINAEVDAVQTHNAKEAIKSACGVDVNIAPDKSLSLQ